MEDKGNQYSEGNRVWGHVDYSVFFELLKTSQKISGIDTNDEGTIPVYSSDSRNNGRVGYCEKEPHFKISDEIPFYVLFGDHTKTMNIVDNDFCIKDNVKVLKPKIFDTEVMLFIFAAWKKSIPELGYARHWSVAREAEILIPFKNGVVDINYMKTFIRALEKISTNSVSKWREKEISTAKEIIKE